MLAKTDEQVLLENPQLAMLCIELTRGSQQLSDAVILRTAEWLAKEHQLAEETATLYRDLMVDALDGELLEHVRAIMNFSELDPNSPIFQRYFARGERLGEIRALRQSLRTFADARGLELGLSQLQTVEACEDIDQLKLWIRTAATADSAKTIFR